MKLIENGTAMLGFLKDSCSMTWQQSPETFLVSGFSLRVVLELILF